MARIAKRMIWMVAPEAYLQACQKGRKSSQLRIPEGTRDSVLESDVARLQEGSSPSPLAHNVGGSKTGSDRSAG
eukprot:747595-Hanusia_phi.AAC.4